MSDDLIEQVARAIYACHFADTAEAQAMMEMDWPRLSPLKLMVQREAKAVLRRPHPHFQGNQQ